jgi:O-acetyl-ADP-ribose deacetylase (regulator of RNase III)
LVEDHVSPLPAKDYVLVLQTGNRVGLRLLQGDLTEYPCDAIVNAANSDLLPGGGLCGAIHFKGGIEIARECGRWRRARGPVSPGHAVATTAGTLPARYVIHAVGPVWEGGHHHEAEILASSYRDSIRVAEQLRLHSIAFPAISTGIYRYPVKQAAAVAVPTLLQGLRDARHLVLISLILFGRSTLEAFSQAALAYRDDHSGSALPYSIAILD